jgi:hypothetical protein
MFLMLSVLSRMHCFPVFVSSFSLATETMYRGFIVQNYKYRHQPMSLAQHDWTQYLWYV